MINGLKNQHYTEKENNNRKNFKKATITYSLKSRLFLNVSYNRFHEELHGEKKFARKVCEFSLGFYSVGLRFFFLCVYSFEKMHISLFSEKYVLSVKVLILVQKCYRYPAKKYLSFFSYFFSQCTDHERFVDAPDIISLYRRLTRHVHSTVDARYRMRSVRLPNKKKENKTKKKTTFFCPREKKGDKYVSIFEGR